MYWCDNMRINFPNFFFIFKEEMKGQKKKLKKK